VLEARSVEDDSLTEVEDCSSPDSCGSGPTYGPRKPGFKHHAHQQRKKREPPPPLEPPRPQIKRGQSRKIFKLLVNLRFSDDFDCD
jgi:hypothetical protein